MANVSGALSHFVTYLFVILVDYGNLRCSYVRWRLRSCATRALHYPESLAQILPRPFVDTYVYHSQTAILSFNTSTY